MPDPAAPAGQPRCGRFFDPHGRTDPLSPSRHGDDHLEVVEYEEIDLGGLWGNRLERAPCACATATSSASSTARRSSTTAATALPHADPVLTDVLRRARGRDQRILDSLTLEELIGASPGWLAEPRHRPDAAARPRAGRERATRKPLAFWDRVKFLWLFAAALRVPVVAGARPTTRCLGRTTPCATPRRRSGGCSLLAGIELLRQLHYLVWPSTRPATTAFVDRHGLRPLRAAARARCNPGTATGSAGSSSWLVLLALLSVVLGAMFDVAAGHRACSSCRPRLVRRPRRSSSSWSSAFFFVIVQFVGLFWFLSRGGSTSTSPTTSRPASPTCGARTPCSSGSRRTSSSSSDPEQIEEQGRLRARRHPAVGPARHRQDAAWPRPSPARPASRSCSSTPAPSSDMFMGVGILKVKCAVPQAAQAGAALRRRHRVLRRGRLARQPRHRRRPAARRPGVASPAPRGDEHFR